MTVIQLGGAMLWGAVTMLPILLLQIAREEKDPGASAFLSFLAFACQVGFGVACYIAGGVK